MHSSHVLCFVLSVVVRWFSGAIRTAGCAAERGGATELWSFRGRKRRRRPPPQRPLVMTLTTTRSRCSSSDLQLIQNFDLDLCQPGTLASLRNFETFHWKRKAPKNAKKGGGLLFLLSRLGREGLVAWIFYLVATFGDDPGEVFFKHIA